MSLFCSAHNYFFISAIWNITICLDHFCVLVHWPRTKIKGCQKSKGISYSLQRNSRRGLIVRRVWKSHPVSRLFRFQISKKYFSSGLMIAKLSKKSFVPPPRRHTEWPLLYWCTDCTYWTRPRVLWNQLRPPVSPSVSQSVTKVLLLPAISFLRFFASSYSLMSVQKWRSPISKKKVSPNYFTFCLQNRGFSPFSRDCRIRFC